MKGLGVFLAFGSVVWESVSLSLSLSVPRSGVWWQ